jgi:transcriptional regulator with XRE-family HTH domain
MHLGGWKFMKELQKRLRSKRNELGLTQAQVADKAKINTSTYSSYESGKMPPVDVACRIAKALGVNMDWLYNPEVTEDDIEFSGSSYGDVVRLIVSLALMQPKNIEITMNTRGSSRPQENGVGMNFLSNYPANYKGIDYFTNLKFNEQIVYEFMEGFKKLYDLYTNGTIEKEMLDAWLQKKYAELKQIPLSST